MVMGYRSTNKTVYAAKYHIIWCPKYRRRVLVGAVEDRLNQLIVEVTGEPGATVLELEVMPDHVHLLVEIPPTIALSRLVGLVKGRSSRVLRQEFPALRRLPALWTRSWFVGGAPLDVVRRYVENQKTAA
ncbi:MAG: IS200/IS605 family transposase [Actinobacteria bacterium]|nr:IS200/IS605 family transposase [Actinomycetota bacterium]